MVSVSVIFSFVLKYITCPSPVSSGLEGTPFLSFFGNWHLQIFGQVRNWYNIQEEMGESQDIFSLSCHQ